MQVHPTSALTAAGVMSRTVLASPFPTPARLPGGGKVVTGPASLPQPQSATAATTTGRASMGWVAGSIGYIYTYLRGKLDVGERRRRLIEERDGAARLLAGAVTELGATILKDGIQQSDLTGLLEAIGRAEARREAAVADVASSERLQAAEDKRLGRVEEALEAEWRACDSGSHEADDLLRAVTQEAREIGSRLARIRDERGRLEREAELVAASPEGRKRSQQLRHETATLRTEHRTLEEQSSRLEKQLADLRDRSAALRAASAEARSKLDAAVATRRQAASAMAASIAGHSRERASAEQEVRDLTGQLGRAALQARPSAPTLRPAYQRIDRLEETLAERTRQIAALDRSLDHYDQKRLITGVGLVTSLIVSAVVGLWVVLK
jgi:chromosome segregation ATPase